MSQDKGALVRGENWGDPTVPCSTASWMSKDCTNWGQYLGNMLQELMKDQAHSVGSQKESSFWFRSAPSKEILQSHHVVHCKTYTKFNVNISCKNWETENERMFSSCCKEVPFSWNC